MCKDLAGAESLKADLEQRDDYDSAVGSRFPWHPDCQVKLFNLPAIIHFQKIHTDLELIANVVPLPPPPLPPSVPL